MSATPRRHGSFQNEAKAWCEHFTADYITSKSDHMLGVDGYKHIFMIRDMWSGMCHAFPTKIRYTEETVEAFNTFVGANPNQEYHVIHQHGVPGIHQSNAVIERSNRE
eukprot:11198879-Lingulodinium_polyedra.AAC.1